MQIIARWDGEHRFDTGRPDGAPARFDGSGTGGQSPMDALLSALAACAGIDVVDILGKRRTLPQRFRIEADGRRRDTPPRRYTHIALRFMLDGGDVEAVHAERAISLAFEKYCSVAASLAPDTVLETTLVLNGVVHEKRSHRLTAGG